MHHIVIAYGIGGAGVATFTIRTSDDALGQALKRESRRRGLSVNRLVIDTLKESLLVDQTRRRRHDDLDDLCGSWSQEEADEFDASIKGFGEIDRELWR